MKVDRAMLVWDGNPFYEGFYDMHLRIWPKLGIKTGLVFVANGKNDHLIPTKGDIRVVRDTSSVPFTPPPGRNWKATMAIIHGPRLFPGEVIRVTGMDQFPANRRFLEALEPIPDDTLVTAIGDKNHVPTGSIIAHHDVWTRIMEPTPKDFTELIEWTWSLNQDVSGYAPIATGWGNDEVLFSRMMQRLPDLKIHTLFPNCWEGWLNRVLGITQVIPDQKLLREGFYSELHIRRPISKLDRSTFETLVEIL